MGRHALLQGIFLTQGTNPCLLHLLPWQGGSLPLRHLQSSGSGRVRPKWVFSKAGQADSKSQKPSPESTQVPAGQSLSIEVVEGLVCGQIYLPAINKSLWFWTLGQGAKPDAKGWIQLADMFLWDRTMTLINTLTGL